MEVLAVLILIVLAAVLVALVAVWRTLSRGASARQAETAAARIESLERAQERLDRTLRDEASRIREAIGGDGRALRTEVGQCVESLRTTTVHDAAKLREEVTRSVSSAITLIEQQMHTLRESSAASGRALREEVNQSVSAMSGLLQAQLKTLQEDNASKLEQMRATVDEKLQGTLEKRLGESFRSVSEQLEKVHRGLGEMKSLSEGVGDLRKVLTNVKTRGTWGEVQLGALLEQMLTAEQFDRNVPVTGGPERVEYAIRLPGRETGDGAVWLPIDAKFPQEDYMRLVEASERADAEAVEQAARNLELRLKACARDIHLKYVHPPQTTDFAILYLPTEGLYAEALRRPGLAECLQRDFRVVVAGPTTVSALLNSLQVGFRSLAIQKRSSEVWDVLGKVKCEFGKYAGVLEKVQRKLHEASNTVDDAARRTRAIERSLRKVESDDEPELFDGLDDEDVTRSLTRTGAP